MKGWIDLGKEMAADFSASKDNLQYLKDLAVLSVPKQVFLLAYNVLHRSKKILTIEFLSPEDKNKTWETAKEIADGRITSNEEMKDICRCLITLEYLLQ